MSGDRPRQPLCRGACQQAARGGAGRPGARPGHAAVSRPGAPLVQRRLTIVSRAVVAGLPPAGTHRVTRPPTAPLAGRYQPHPNHQASRPAGPLGAGRATGHHRRGGRAVRLGVCRAAQRCLPGSPQCPYRSGARKPLPTFRTVNYSIRRIARRSARAGRGSAGAATSVARSAR